MSLWTPGGEHPVGKDPAAGSGPPAAPPPPGAPSRDPSDDDPFAGLSQEQRAEAEAMAAQMQEVRQQLAETPAAVVVANHAMGLYELAAIHLGQQPPNLAEAQVAIDGFAALVGALKGRLGPDEPTLTDALGQLRLAFVQLSGGGAGPEDANA